MNCIYLIINFLINVSLFLLLLLTMVILFRAHLDVHAHVRSGGAVELRQPGSLQRDRAQRERHVARQRAAVQRQRQVRRTVRGGVEGAAEHGEPLHRGHAVGLRGGGWGGQARYSN